MALSPHALRIMVESLVRAHRERVDISDHEAAKMTAHIIGQINAKDAQGKS